jgi:hypothetical protein
VEVLLGSSFTTVVASDTVARDWQLATQGVTLFLVVPAGTPLASLNLSAAVAAGNSSNRGVVLRVAGVLPGAVALQQSIEASQMQRAADAGGQFLPVLMSAGSADGVQPLGAIAVPVRGINRVVIPALRSGSSAAHAAATSNWTGFAAAGRLGSQGFVQDPGLTAALTLVQLAADGVTPAVNGTQQVLSGNWSSSQQGYVLAFRCPVAAAYWLELSLTAMHSNNSISQVRGPLWARDDDLRQEPFLVSSHTWCCACCCCTHIEACNPCSSGHMQDGSPELHAPWPY